MIVLTGAAGFIGSCLLGYLNQLGYKDIVIVDDFDHPQKKQNWLGKQYRFKVHRAQLFDWLTIHKNDISFVFHLGARTDTTEQNRRLFDGLNYTYTKRIWWFCCQNDLPLVYASSAATYGLGENGFEDSHSRVSQLAPLNAYGESKQHFDQWALTQRVAPPRWAGLKFFNVYGPNEYHKGRMASVVWHTFRQIKKTGAMQLFRSHRPEIKDGEQRRDFIFVQDVLQVCVFFLENKMASGLYNVGTGRSRTFWDLATQTFLALGLEPAISFIDTPVDIRKNYQYFTEAPMRKLINAGYPNRFFSLEEGVSEYVKKYLLNDNYF